MNESRISEASEVAKAPEVTEVHEPIIFEPTISESIVSEPAVFKPVVSVPDGETVIQKVATIYSKKHLLRKTPKGIKNNPTFLIEDRKLHPKKALPKPQPIKTNGKLDLMAMIIEKVESDPAKFIDELMSESKHNLTLRKDILDRLVGKAGEQQQQTINVSVISYKNADLNSSMISSSPSVSV